MLLGLLGSIWRQAQTIVELLGLLGFIVARLFSRVPFILKLRCYVLPSLFALFSCSLQVDWLRFLSFSLGLFCFFNDYDGFVRRQNGVIIDTEFCKFSNFKILFILGLEWNSCDYWCGFLLLRTSLFFVVVFFDSDFCIFWTMRHRKNLYSTPWVRLVLFVSALWFVIFSTAKA